MEQKYILGCISFLIHCLITIVFTIAPFLTDDRRILYALLIIYSLLLAEWYILGGSCLNDLDQWFFDKDNGHEIKYHTGAKASVFLIKLQEITGLEMGTLSKITTLGPVVLTGYIVYKLYQMDSKIGLV